MPEPTSLATLLEQYRAVEEDIRDRQRQLESLRGQIAQAAKELGIADILGGERPARGAKGGEKRFVLVERSGGREKPVTDARGRVFEYDNKMSILRGAKYQHLASRVGRLALKDRHSGDVVVEQITLKS